VTARVPIPDPPKLNTPVDRLWRRGSVTSENAPQALIEALAYFNSKGYRVARLKCIGDREDQIGIRTDLAYYIEDEL